MRQVDGIREAPKRLDEANKILRSRRTYAGTTFKFSNEQDDFWRWLLDSADANAARLILAAMDDPGWREDVLRMVVGALLRQRAGALADDDREPAGLARVDKFSAKFEWVALAGRTTASLGDKRAAVDWLQGQAAVR